MLKFLYKFVQTRVFVLILLLLVQVLIAVFLFVKAQEAIPFLLPLSYAFSIFMVAWILSRDMHTTYKLAWIVPILLLPIFGGLFYLLFGTHGFKKRKLLDRFEPYLQSNSSQRIIQDKNALKALKDESEDAYLQARYLFNTIDAPVYTRTQTQYYKSGEEFYECFMQDIKQAKKYIFIEFFIIEEGVMLNPMLDILEQKAKEGLDVRIMYDDVGTALRVSPNFFRELEDRGIKAAVFNAKGLKLSFVLNNRDHRKICVIDGVIAYTGGCNIADEYINAISPYGYWKDTMVRLEGDAAWGFLTLFHEMWTFAKGDIEERQLDFAPEFKRIEHIESDGFVLPFGDASPLDGIASGKYTYLNAIQDARESILITTPYLVLDSEIVSALKISAEMGIDVRIITPGIPDKWYVFAVTRANYTELLKSGVKIYEYSPGFIHAKSMVVDNKIGIVGTVNFDYRSFYLHFECGVWMYNSKAVHQCYEDLLETCEVSKQISLNEQLNTPVPVRIGRSILSIFAPLM